MTPRLRLARFADRGCLGRGGTAEVVRVHDSVLQRDLALKLPLSESDEHHELFRRLAEREHRLIGPQRYPGLVRILDYFPDGDPGLALELCTGQTMHELGRVDNIELALNLISSLAATLEYLRLCRLVHGDLKPHNVFVPSDIHQPGFRPDQLFFTKLSDFSLGRTYDESNSERAGLGTVGYMAPETVVDGAADSRSDLFALGVIAYELLTGINPFMHQDSDPVKVNSRVREETPAAADSLIESVPPDVASLVDDLLAKEPSDRPKSGWEVCCRLEKAGASYPYRRALQPRYLIATRSEDVPASIGDETSRERLTILSAGNPATTRAIVSANFLNGNLSYDGSAFRFGDGVWWPRCLRRSLVRSFAARSLSVRKRLLRAAVVGDVDTARELGFFQTGDDVRMLELLTPLVSAPTLRRVSAGCAPGLKEAGALAVASRLFVQAQNLEQAEACAFEAANHLRSQHNNVEALEIVRPVLQLATAADREFDVRQLLMLEADLEKENGEAERAESLYWRLVDIYRDKPADVLLAETYKDLGDLYKMKQRFEKGREVLEKALEIYRQLGSDLEVSHTLNNMGNMYWVATDYAQALKYYRSALKTQRRLEAKLETASTLNNIGSIYVINGRHDRGLRLYNLSLNLKKEVGHQGEIARTLNNLGYTYHVAGKQDQAVASLAESLQINRRIGSKKEILYNLENLTTVQIVAGRLKDSLAHLRNGLSLAEQLGDLPHAGVFNINMATVLRRMGNYSASEDCLGRVDEISTNIDDKRLQILLHLNRAWLREYIGDSERAAACAVTALETAQGISDRAEEVHALMLLAYITEDRKHYEQAARLVEELHLQREALLLVAQRIDLLLRTANIEEAQKLSVAYPDLLPSLSEDIDRARVGNLLAQVALESGQPDKAQAYLDNSRAFATRAGLTPDLMTNLVVSGRVMFAQGDYEGCFRYYRQGLDACKQIASSMKNPEDQKFFQGKREVQFLVEQIRQLQSKLVRK